MGIAVDVVWLFMALLSFVGISTPSLKAQGEQRRSFLFNIPRDIPDQEVDGILFLTNHVDDGTLSRQIARSGRVVLVDEDVKDAPAPRVFANNETGGALAG